jgi:hypothetical protein
MLYRVECIYQYVDNLLHTMDEGVLRRYSEEQMCSAFDKMWIAMTRRFWRWPLSKFGKIEDYVG